MLVEKAEWIWALLVARAAEEARAEPPEPHVRLVGERPDAHVAVRADRPQDLPDQDERGHGERQDQEPQ